MRCQKNKIEILEIREVSKLQNVKNFSINIVSIFNEIFYILSNFYYIIEMWIHLLGKCWTREHVKESIDILIKF